MRFQFPVALVLIFGSVFLAPSSAEAARLFSSGCEFAGDSNGYMQGGYEFELWGDTDVSRVSTTVKRSGESSCRTVATSAGKGYFLHRFASSDITSNIYVRFYFKAAVMSTEDVDILRFRDDSTVGSLILRPDGKLGWEGWTENSTPDYVSTGAAITSSNWYRIEVMYNGDSRVIVRVDGTEFLNVPDNGSNGATDVYFGMCENFCGGDNETIADYYFDDIAINDTTGPHQNTWPGSGSIVHIQPDAPGDINQCNGQNYLQIDEITPDDAATLCALTNSNNTIDVNVESPLSAGIHPQDRVMLIQVGTRLRPVSASAGEFQLRLKSGAGATATTSKTVSINSGSWGAYTTNPNSPRNYKLTAYTDPTTNCAWTQNGAQSLENMQIGIATKVGNPDLNVSTLWALVETDARFIEPCAKPNAGNPPDAISTALSFSSVYKQVKSGSIWAPSIAADKICFGNGLNCTSTWNRAPKCRLEHHRVTARPNATGFPSWGLPNFSNDIATNTCDSMLSAASVAAGWVSTGYDYSLRVFANDGHAPRVCQFTRLVCDNNVQTQAPTVTGPSVHPVSGFTQ